MSHRRDPCNFFYVYTLIDKILGFQRSIKSPSSEDGWDESENDSHLFSFGTYINTLINLNDFMYLFENQQALCKCYITAGIHLRIWPITIIIIIITGD